MSRSRLLILGLVMIALVVGLIALTVLLVPSNTHPAFDVAVEFAQAGLLGADDVALSMLSKPLIDYVSANCPDESVSGCLQGYTPEDWGGITKEESVVFRRAVPDGTDAWDILLVASYAEGQGFSGVCIYQRVEEIAPDDWQVSAWSGFISCDEPNAGLAELSAPDAPNRAP